MNNQNRKGLFSSVPLAILLFVGCMLLASPEIALAEAANVSGECCSYGCEDGAAGNALPSHVIKEESYSAISFDGSVHPSLDSAVHIDQANYQDKQSIGYVDGLTKDDFKAETVDQETNNAKIENNGSITSSDANNESVSSTEEKQDTSSVKHLADGWIIDGNYHYYYRDGEPLSGQQNINGCWYCFDDSGHMITGWKWLDEEQKWVFYADSGKMIYGQNAVPSEVSSDDTTHWYYMDDVTGARLFGWKYIQDQEKWVYYSTDTGMMVYGRCYCPQGNNIDDPYHWYYFDEITGATQYGWKHLEPDGIWVYYEPIVGWMDYGERCVPCNNLPGADYHWYYFDNNTGAALYGWQWLSTGSKWVFYDPICAWMMYGEQCLQSGNSNDPTYRWYYLDDVTGAATYGWKWIQSQNKAVYYAQIVGWMLYGWQNLENGYYHFSEFDGRLDELNCGNGVINCYVNWMLGIAADDSHGYDQAYRWGERGDFDCSSMVVTALRQAGLDTGGATYTGNMRYYLAQHGFVWMTDFSLLQVGDVLLNTVYHTAVYLGNNLLVHASGNEYGEAIGGQPGDQTGSEICVRSYFWRPWDGYLRYIG